MNMITIYIYIYIYIYHDHKECVMIMINNQLVYGQTSIKWKRYEEIATGCSNRPTCNPYHSTVLLKHYS